MSRALVSAALVSAALICGALLFPAAAGAGRPLVVDDAPAVDAGTLELELGVTQSLPEKGGREQALPVVALTYGVVPSLETGLSIQRVHDDLKRAAPADGFSDLHLNAKYNFFRGEWYDFSFVFDLKIPTANRRKGLSTGRFEENFLLMATRHFDRAGVDLNFGYLVVDSPRGAKLKDRFFGGSALRYALNETWTLVGEVYGLSRAVGGANNQANFQLGFRYKPDLPVFFDAALGRSLLPTGSKILGTVGLTWDVPVMF